jgi:hypothetical protein
VLVFVVHLSDSALAAGGYSNARDLQADCQATVKFARKEASAPEMYSSGYCYGFLSGVADALALGETLPGVEAATPEDMAHVVLQYLDEHPEMLRHSAATVVRTVFRQTYGVKR